MDQHGIQWVGAPCGQHGPYIFYKGFKYYAEGKWKILSLGEFFFVRCSDEDPICICEIQLLWEDKSNNGQLLSSSRLYFLPEDTPEGRTECYGEDEVLAVSEKVIVRIDDLVEWITSGKEWNKGTLAICEKDLKGDHPSRNTGLLEAFASNNERLNIKDIKKERKLIGCDADNDNSTKVIILSYPKYCRYKAILKRIQHMRDYWLGDTLVMALGGFTVKHPNTRILYCKDIFDHPTLPDNEKLCEHMAPNLKGRPRKKKLKIKTGRSASTASPGSPDSSNDSDHTSPAPVVKPGPKGKNERCYKDGLLIPNIKTKAQKEGQDTEEAEFLASLYKYMRERNTPIERIPHLGFKQIDLYYFFKLATKWGGYEKVTNRKLWKHIYDGLGGNPGSTSAATCTRRHYERLILPYERHLRGEDDKPPPPPIKHRSPHLLKRPHDHVFKHRSHQSVYDGPYAYHEDSDEKLLSDDTNEDETPDTIEAEVKIQDKENKSSSLRMVISKDENNPNQMMIRPRVTFKKGSTSNEVKVQVEPPEMVTVKKEGQQLSRSGVAKAQSPTGVSSVRVQKTITVDAIPAIKAQPKSVSSHTVTPASDFTVKKEVLEPSQISDSINSFSLTSTATTSSTLTPAPTRSSQSIMPPLVRKKFLSGSRSRSPLLQPRKPVLPVPQPSATTSANTLNLTTMTSAVNMSTAASSSSNNSSGGNNNNNSSSQLSSSGLRPSVIQHTQRSKSTQLKETAESTTQSVEEGNHGPQAIQASDLILRHISQDQIAINRAFYERLNLPQHSDIKEVTPRKRTYPHKMTQAMSPYYPYFSQSRTSEDRAQTKHELGQLQMEPYFEKSKRSRLDSEGEDAQYYTKTFCNFASERHGDAGKDRTPGVAHGGALHNWYNSVSDQDQPTDLSLPKKRRKSIDDGIQREETRAVSSAGERVSIDAADEPKDLRTTKSVTAVLLTNNLPLSENSMSKNTASEKKPSEARGSITQGVINTTVAATESTESSTGRSSTSSCQAQVSIPEYDPKLPPVIPHVMIPDYNPSIPTINKGHIPSILDYSQLYQMGYPTHLLSPHSALLAHSHLYGARAHMQATQQAYEELMHQQLVASQQLAARHAQFASQHLSRESHPSYVYPS
ncbi:AT-rich interactive domain-containing protein 5B-like [Ptychodera flava]|uniref:AT-rich interactive domain-containing protein 5B-like n=1 Tax=Ptychodera flava TaxID=63121 RepID=UPI00396AA4C4